MRWNNLTQNLYVPLFISYLCMWMGLLNQKHHSFFNILFTNAMHLSNISILGFIIFYHCDSLAYKLCETLEMQQQSTIHFSWIQIQGTALISESLFSFAVRLFNRKSRPLRWVLHYLAINGWATLNLPLVSKSARWIVLIWIPG